MGKLDQRQLERWAKDFCEFWDLPEDFDYSDVETPEVDIAKALIAQAAAS